MPGLTILQAGQTKSSRKLDFKMPMTESSSSNLRTTYNTSCGRLSALIATQSSTPIPSYSTASQANKMTIWCLKRSSGLHSGRTSTLKIKYSQSQYINKVRGWKTTGFRTRVRSLSQASSTLVWWLRMATGWWDVSVTILTFRWWIKMLNLRLASTSSWSTRSGMNQPSLPAAIRM